MTFLLISLVRRDPARSACTQKARVLVSRKTTTDDDDAAALVKTRANKRRNAARAEAEERAITCDQYARLRSCRRFSAWAIDIGAAAAFPVPVASTRYYARSPASFACALHTARGVFSLSRESDANDDDDNNDGGGGVEGWGGQSDCFSLFLSEWKHRWHSFVPLVPVVRAAFNSRVHTVSGSLLGRRTNE